LQPGLTYGLRLSKDNGEVFACYTDELDDRTKDLSSAQKLPVSRESRTYYFTDHDDLVPPKIFARLEMPPEAHSTSQIPFTFIIEYATDSSSPLVIDKSRSPLSVSSEDLSSLDQLIDCRDEKTREEVSWCGFFGCLDSDPHPASPHEDVFV
jgi:hypothetical protein